MSARAANLPVMRRITETDVLRAFAQEGVAVLETRDGMTGDMVGWYSLQDRAVGIHPDLMQRQRLAVLLHEWHHHVRGDDGHQSPAVEARIDEDVAQSLVDPVDYAFCETQWGWSTGGIAAELEVPRWVIEAYRRVLAREARAA